MSNPYIGEIRIFAGNFAPQGWAFCDGSLYPIAENDALFSLIGTTYGGDGQTTFALPDLRGRLPLHEGTLGSTYVMGQTGGAETVTLSVDQIPAHRHPVVGAGSGATLPSGGLLSTPSGDALYTSSPPDGVLAAGATASAGGGQPHSNLMPYLCVNYIIALFGIFPSQN
jgi:microcystin-dependent protein